MAPVIARAALIAAVALLLSARPLAAQSSPYVPLDDVAYRYVDALRARGALAALPALERPYTALRIRGAVERDSARLTSATLRRWADALLAAVAKHELPVGAGGAPTARGAATLLATAQSSGRRELMLADDSSDAEPGAALRLSMSAGPVVAATRLLVDRRLKHDPEFLGKKDRAITARMEDAYVAAQWRWGEAFLGRTRRLWGVPAVGGLALGDQAYSYDHAAARIGTDRLALRALVAKLDDMRFATDSTAQRWFSIHRLSGRVGGLEIAASEAVVYGGQGRQLELTLVNPVSLWGLAQYDEKEQLNMLYSLEGSWSAGRGGTFGAQLLLDDFQVDECEGGCEEPPSWGLTLAAEGLPLVGEQRWFASYARVTNLAYRAANAFERYSWREVGLGLGYSDFDEARLGVDLALGALPPIRLYGALRRQGEGDYRLPYPSVAEYPSTPTIFAGETARIARLAASGGGRLPGGIELSADVGVNRVTGGNAIAGPEGTRFEGRLRVELAPHWLEGILTP
jgi:hypothetical protein